MRKAIVLLCAEIFAMSANAATVAWNYAEVGSFIDDDGLFYVGGDMGLFTFSAEATPDGALIFHAAPNVGGYMEYRNVAVNAVAGDLINEIFVRYESQAIYRDAMWAWNESEKDSATYDAVASLKHDETTYIGMAVNRWDSRDEVYYGYVEMTLDENNAPMLIAAYVSDVANESVLVLGPIPEPTSAMLVLFGLAALALRRRT